MRNRRLVGGWFIGSRLSGSSSTFLRRGGAIGNLQRLLAAGTLHRFASEFIFRGKRFATGTLNFDGHGDMESFKVNGG